MLGMDAEQLRALQGPLKAKYKESPDAALVTLHARGRVGESRITCRIETGMSGLEAGLHPATGGDGTEACSGDMLLEALAACAGVTLKAVATSMGIAMRSATVSVDGELDFRGTLGVDKSAPVGFRAIRMTFDIDSDASKEQLDKLVQLTERYCVVYQTLAKPAAISVTVK
jgi:uncharacterized OsmC-like protein